MGRATGFEPATSRTTTWRFWFSSVYRKRISVAKLLTYPSIVNEGNLEVRAGNLAAGFRYASGRREAETLESESCRRSRRNWWRRWSRRPPICSVWDSELRGFGVRVYPSGAKKYLLQWKRDGRTRRLALGSHPLVKTDAARAKALDALARIERGEDPAEERDARKADRTVAELLDLVSRRGRRAPEGQGRARPMPACSAGMSAR